jgi:hypothetical protein
VGGNHFEKALTSRADPQQQPEVATNRMRLLISVAHCADKLSVAAGGVSLLTKPMLLVADNINIRSFVANGAFRILTTEETDIVHTADR